MFDFNASTNDVTPVSPIMFSIVLMKKKKKKELMMDAICVLLLFKNSLHRLIEVSVVFDFNASLNDVAPLSPILLADN